MRRARLHGLRGLGDSWINPALKNGTYINEDNPVTIVTDPGLETQFDRADAILAQPANVLPTATGGTMIIMPGQAPQSPSASSSIGSWLSKELFKGSVITNGVAAAGAGLLLTLGIVGKKR